MSEPEQEIVTETMPEPIPETAPVDPLLAGLDPEQQAAVVSRLSEMQTDFTAKLSNMEMDRYNESQQLKERLAQLDQGIKVLEKITPANQPPPSTGDDDEPPEEILGDGRKLIGWMNKRIKQVEARATEKVEEKVKEVESIAAARADETVNARMTAQKQAEFQKNWSEFEAKHKGEDLNKVMPYMRTAWAVAWNNGQPLNGAPARQLSIEEAYQKGKLYKAAEDGEAVRERSKNAPSAPASVNASQVKPTDTIPVDSDWDKILANLRSLRSKGYSELQIREMYGKR